MAWGADINRPRHTVKKCFREVDIPDNLGAREGPAVWHEGVRRPVEGKRNCTVSRVLAIYA